MLFEIGFVNISHRWRIRANVTLCFIRRAALWRSNFLPLRAWLGAVCDLRVSTQVHVLLILAVVSVTVLGGCGQQTNGDAVETARAHISKREYSSAILVLKSALQRRPEDASTRFALGQALFLSGDVAAATVELKKAVEMGHEPIIVVPVLARALMLNGQANKLIESYSQTELKSTTANADLKTSLALAYQAIGDIAKSRTLVQVALDNDPRFVPARILKARLLAASSAFDPALAELTELLNDMNPPLDAWQLKGDILRFGKSDEAGAVKAYEGALKVNPRHLPALVAMVEIPLGRGNLVGARTHLGVLKKLLPNNGQTLFLEAQIALAGEDLKTARERLQMVRRSTPDNGRLLTLAGAIELHSGALLLAENNFSKALQLDPRGQTARQLLAETQLRAGDPTKALETLAPLLQSDKANASALGMAAEAYLQLGNAEKAAGYFAVASKASPNDQRFRAALALTKIASGESASGFDELEAAAAADSGTYSDMALVSARMHANDFSGALRAVSALGKKQPSKPLADYMRGQIQLRQHHLPAARASFERALEIDKVYFPAVSALAGMDLADKLPDQAKKRFDAQLSIEPKNHRALLAIAELKARTGGSPAEVASLIDMAAKAEPTAVSPHMKLIDLYLATNNPKAALAAAQTANAAIADNLEVVDALGRAQLAAGESQQAIASFRKIVTAVPSSPQPLMRLAEAYVALKENPAAIQTLRTVLQNKPDFLPAQRLLLQLIVAERKWPEALSIAQSVQRQRPGSPEGFLWEGEIALAQRKYDSAASLLRAALQRKKSTEAAVKLHATLVAARRAAEAERFAANWLTEQKQDAGFAQYLGDRANARGEYLSAERLYRTVLSIDKDRIAALNNLSWVLMKQSKPGAREYAARADLLSPNTAAVLDTLAMAFASEKKFAEALEIQKRAVALAPENPALRLHLAELATKMGDKRLAKAELEKLIYLGDKFSGQSEVVKLLKAMQ